MFVSRSRYPEIRTVVPGDTLNRNKGKFDYFSITVYSIVYILSTMENKK